MNDEITGVNLVQNVTAYKTSQRTKRHNDAPAVQNDAYFTYHYSHDTGCYVQNHRR